MRHRHHLRMLFPQTPVVTDVWRVTGVAQLALAAYDLAGDRGVGALDQSGVVGEVVHEADDVRQFGEGREGGSAFVIRRGSS